MSGGSRRTHCKFMPSAESRIPHVLHASPLSVRRRLISVSIIEKHDLAISASLKHSNSSINCTPRALANPSIATYPERMVRGSRYGLCQSPLRQTTIAPKVADLLCEAPTR